MEWSIAKLGSAMFDALHAYGLAFVLATASGEKVTVRDEGILYGVTSPIQTAPAASVELLDQMLPLPDEHTLLAFEPGMQESCAVRTLDGLLAALLTTPGGKRAASVCHLLHAQRFDSQAVQRGLSKVTGSIQRWKRYLQRQRASGPGWVADMLRDYERFSPRPPVPAQGQPKKDLHVLLTLDPSLGYSPRRPINDGFLTCKSNVAIRGTRYAALLAFLGAARFLRAHYLYRDVINFTIPFTLALDIDADTALPILFPLDCSPEIALVRRWLNLASTTTQPGTVWSGLGFQMLQLQGQQQVICVGGGVLDSVWLNSVEKQVGRAVLVRWRQWLKGDVGNARKKEERTPDEKAHLAQCLMYRYLDGWYCHLQEVAQRIVDQARRTVRSPRIPESRQVYPYSVEEVRRITSMMDDQPSHPLRTILERKAGTYRFGQALRQLGQVYPALLQDLIEALEALNTLEQFLPVVHRVLHECELAKVKLRSDVRARYIIIPSDDDFAQLLDDLQRFGVHLIVGMLLVLSSLRYPHPDGVDKYSVHTLISVLLFLSAQSTPSEAAADEPPHDAVETFSGSLASDFPFSEGEDVYGDTHSAANDV
jgi:hypothetical protein